MIYFNCLPAEASLTVSSTSILPYCCRGKRVIVHALETVGLSVGATVLTVAGAVATATTLQQVQEGACTAAFLVAGMSVCDGFTRF